MRLNEGQQIASAASLVAALVCGGIALVPSGRDIAGVREIFGAMSLGLLLGGVPFILHLCRRRPPPRYQRDVLLEDLGLDGIAEEEGVQFALIPVPDELLSPSHGVVAILLQNAHGSPRRVTVSITGGAVEMPYRTVRVSLEGGQVRLITLPFLLPAGRGAGDEVLGYSCGVELPGEEGARVIRRRGGPAPSAGGRSNLEVRVRGPHQGLPASGHLSGLRLDEVLFETGRERPDLAPVRGLFKPGSTPYLS